MTVLIDYTKGFFETTEGDGVGTVTGNATLDLSTGSVFSHTPTANTTFAFSNPPASGTASSATLKLTGANITSGYDLANASYDSKSFAVTSQAPAPFDLDFKPDGTSFIVVGQSSDTVYQYNCSTAWDISTASYANKSLNVSSQAEIPRSLMFNNDGTKIYVLDSSPWFDKAQRIYEYGLSTAYDVSTGSYNNVSLDLSTAASNFTGNQFFIPSGGSQDGTKVYAGCYNNDRIYSWTLSTAWDLSTASLDSTSFSVSSYDGVHAGMYVNSDGTKWWIGARQSDKIIQFSMSTPYDISTSSKDTAELSWSGQTTDVYGFKFKNDDGAKLYLMSPGDDTIYQYSTAATPAPATITYPSSVIWSGGITPTAPANGETDVYTFYTDDGGTTYYGFQVGDALA